METMFTQNFGGKTKSIMVFLKVAYCNALDRISGNAIGSISSRCVSPISRTLKAAENREDTDAKSRPVLCADTGL